MSIEHLAGGSGLLKPLNYFKLLLLIIIVICNRELFIKIESMLDWKPHAEGWGNYWIISLMTTETMESFKDLKIHHH